MSEEWKKHAACRGMPVDMFFDDYEDDNTIQLAVDDVCGSCIVRKDCLEWALAEGLTGGVFGRKYLGQSPKAKKKRKEYA